MKLTETLPFPIAESFRPDVVRSPSHQMSPKQEQSKASNLGMRRITICDMQKPNSMQQFDYNNVPKNLKRQLPDPQGRDETIKIPGHPTQY